MRLLFTGIATFLSHILGGGEPGMGPMTLKFELGRNFVRMHLPTSFHHPMFNRSNKQANKEILLRKHPHRFTVPRRWKKTSGGPTV